MRSVVSAVRQDLHSGADRPRSRSRQQLSALRTIVYIKAVLPVTCDGLAPSNMPDLVALSLPANTNELVLTPAATRVAQHLFHIAKRGSPCQNSILGDLMVNCVIEQDTCKPPVVLIIDHGCYSTSLTGHRHCVNTGLVREWIIVDFSVCIQSYPP